MQEAMKPPSSVLSASILYFLPAPLAFIRVAFLQGNSLNITRSVIWLLVVAFFYWISLSLYRGKKWAWWWAVLITGIGTILELIKPRIPALQPEASIYWVQSLMVWASCVLLLLPISRKWFAA